MTDTENLLDLKLGQAYYVFAVRELVPTGSQRAFRMQSQKSRNFTLAHLIAKNTASVVGDYRIALSIALKDIAAKRVKMSVVKTAEDDNYDRSLTRVYSLCKLECGAMVIICRKFKDNCTQFELNGKLLTKNMEVVELTPAVNAFSAIKSKFISPAEKFILKTAMVMLGR